MVSHVSNDGIQYVDKLLRDKDLKGAIDFAKRVKTSSRYLKRLSQFLANIVVLQTSNEDEEPDWYSVLGVDPSADIKTMKVQYKRLVPLIKEIGSYEAYRLLDKAWLTLSNKFTRKDYDLERRSREKSLLTDADKNILMTKARNVILNQLNKSNVGAIDHTEGNAAATGAPEEDGLKSMQVLDDIHEFDQKRTQESVADKKLNAYYAEIEDDFAHLLDIPGISY